MNQQTERRFICDVDLGGCGKKTHEPRGLEGFRGFVGGNIPKNVEVEYFDLCEKCGDKKIREQKLLIRVTGAASAGILTEEELKIFGNWGKLSAFQKRVFIENLQRKEKYAQKIQKENMMKRLKSKEKKD